jgi:hypothetical protein
MKLWNWEGDCETRLMPSLRRHIGLVSLGKDPVDIIVNNRALLAQGTVNLHGEGAKLFPG